MKKLLLAIMAVLTANYTFAQNQITTTGNNLVDPTNPHAADIVIGSDAGARHDASIMWWSNVSASRISNTNDIFNFSQWSTTTPNVALSAIVGGSSYLLGNVGIGTTTPDYKLSVNGNFKVFGFGNPNNYFLYSGGADLDMRCADRGTGGRVFVHDFNNICTINYGGDFTGGTKIGSNAFFSEGTTGISYIKGGYVGIGTSQPDQALTVSGTVHATEVLVDQTIKTPDYVFDKDYDLKSLKDVKTYIDQNHHLPEIPSAAQVAKEGINLGEMNTRLLKKIEELTLYLIDLRDENEKLNQRVNKLEKKN